MTFVLIPAELLPCFDMKQGEPRKLEIPSEIDFIYLFTDILDLPTTEMNTNFVFR